MALCLGLFFGAAHANIVEIRRQDLGNGGYATFDHVPQYKNPSGVRYFLEITTGGLTTGVLYGFNQKNVSRRASLAGCLFAEQFHRNLRDPDRFTEPGHLAIIGFGIIFGFMLGILSKTSHLHQPLSDNNDSPHHTLDSDVLGL